MCTRCAGIPFRRLAAWNFNAKFHTLITCLYRHAMNEPSGIWYFLRFIAKLHKVLARQHRDLHIQNSVLLHMCTGGWRIRCSEWVSEDGGSSVSQAVRAAAPTGGHDAMSRVSRQSSLCNQQHIARSDCWRRPAYAVRPAANGASSVASWQRDCRRQGQLPHPQTLGSGKIVLRYVLGENFRPKVQKWAEPSNLCSGFYPYT